jgi:hypothetical protein
MIFKIKGGVMKKMFLIIVLFLHSCSLENQKTKAIASINIDEVDSSFWRDLESKYYLDSTRMRPYPLHFFGLSIDSALKRFSNDNAKYIVHFKDDPQEVVGFDDFSLRTVYSPSLAVGVLDNISSSIGPYHKRRIATRLQLLIMKYQSEKESFKSLNMMRSETWVDQDSGRNDGLK